MFDCTCVVEWMRRGPQIKPRLHLEEQDTRSRPWERLIELVEKAAADGREEFSPRDELQEDWAHILTLPLSANVDETPTPRKFSVEGETGSQDVKRPGRPTDSGRARGDGEGATR